jgi:hypothetical protein
MHRRPLGRGRRLALAGAAILIVACLLPWFSAGGGSDLPTTELRAFDGSGILVFLAGLLTLALASLPYAAGRSVAIDAWPAYVIITGMAVVGVVLWPLDYLSFPAGLTPDHAPGLWVAGLGVLVLARAAFEIWREPVTA